MAKLDDLTQMVTTMYESFEYKLIAKLVKPISALKLTKKVSSALREWDITTIYDLIRSCSGAYLSTVERYRHVHIDQPYRDRIETKLNELGLSLNMTLSEDVMQKVHIRLGRDPETGQ